MSIAAPPARTSTILESTRVRAVAAALAVGGALLLGSAAASAQAAPQKAKIAVVDVRRAVLESAEGKRVAGELKTLVEARQTQLEAKQRKLQEDKAALDGRAQAGRIGKAQIEKGYQDLVKRQTELQQSAAEQQRELERKEQELTAPIMAGVLEAVRRIASQDGFEMVVDKQAAPLFPLDIDITERAVRLFDSEAAKRGPQKPAKQPPAKQPAKPPAKKK